MSEVPELMRTNDIVHTHGLRPDLLIAASRAVTPKHRRARWISTLHCDMNLDLADLYGPRVAAPAAWLWKGALRLADGQVFLSSDIARRYATSVVAAVVRNGIPEDAAHAGPPSPEVESWLAKAREQHIVFGTLANTRPLKRIDLMIEAVARDKRLAFAHFGNGPELAQLVELARRLDVSGRCAFFGHRSDATRYLSDLDVYANCSITEGSPLSVLEAMRAGVPIVAPKIQPFMELFGEGSPQVFAPGNVSALIDAVKRVHHSRAHIGAAQQSAFLRDFTVSAMTARHLDFYRSILA